MPRYARLRVLVTFLLTASLCAFFIESSIMAPLFPMRLNILTLRECAWRPRQHASGHLYMDALAGEKCKPAGKGSQQ